MLSAIHIRFANLFRQFGKQRVVYVVWRRLQTAALFIVSAFISLVSLLVPTSIRGQGSRFAYVVDEGSNAVSVYTVDRTTGTLTLASVTATGSIPASIKVDPSGRFAYVSNLAETSGVPSISVYSIQPNTGALTQIPGSPFPTGIPAGPVEIAIPPSGRFLYVANDLRTPANSLLSAFAIDPASGALTQIQGSPYPTGINSGTVVIDPAGKFLFVGSGSGSNVLANTILAYSISVTTGALSTVPGSPFTSGTDPGVVAVDPSGRFLYVRNDLSNNIWVYQIDSNTGSLTPIPGSPVPTGTSPVTGAIDPAGRFLFVPNQGSNNVSAYSVNSNTGALTPVSGSPFQAGNRPFNAALDPTGTFLYVSNFGSNNISAYAINPNTGALTQVLGSPFATGTGPVSIAVLDENPTVALSILPTHGGNAGNVTVQIFDGGVQNGATVKLTGLGPDIIGATVPSASVLTVTFTLTGATPGARDVIVTNPDGTSATLKGGFTVEQGGSPNITMSIIGRDRIRFNTTQTYYGLIQNHGIVDAVNVAAFLNQLEGKQAPSAFFGSVPALSSLTIPLTAMGPPSGAPLNCPFPFLNGGVHTILPSDPCTTLEAAKAIAQAYLNYLYGLRLANLITLEQSIVNQNCFNPAVPSSSIQCDSLEFADKFLKAQIDAADAAEKALCSVAKALGCPLDCNDPLDINALDLIGNDVADSIQSLKQIFLLVPIPPDQIKNQDSQVALFETQALALPSSLIFPSQPQPEPPTALPPDNSSSVDVCAVGSLDPNSKTGAKGVGALQYVKGDLAVPYSLSFGNEPSATAPAQTVTISDQLNANLDLTTVELGSVNFLNYVVTPPLVPLFLSPFSTIVDLRPANNLQVKVQVSLDTTTGILRGNFQSLDPTTNQPPTDPTVGFLPPDGGGSVFFTVMPKSAITTGTVIQNTATVVFDANPGISTPIVSDTIDNTPPTSHVMPLPAFENSLSFPVQWTGTDVGAGIQDFTVYLSVAGGPFTVFQTNTTATSATLTGQAGHSYAFYSIARDLVGNVEPPKTAAEATTQVGLAFSALTAALELKAGHRSGFEVKGSFDLGGASSGIAPDSQPVTLALGNFSTTIPAGSFRRHEGREYTFEGKINGVRLEFRIGHEHGNLYRFRAKGEGVDLSSTPNPVTVQLLIGNNGGTTQVTAEIERHHDEDAHHENQP